MSYLKKAVQLIKRFPKPFIFASFFFILAGYFWITRAAYVFPGPVFASFIVGLAILIFGLQLGILRARSNPPIILGLESLTERWTKFKGELTEEDQRNLYQQMLDIQMVFHGRYEKIIIKEVFPGNKPEKGALLVQLENNVLRVVKFDSVKNMEIEANNLENCIKPILTHQPGSPTDYWPPLSIAWPFNRTKSTKGVVVYYFAQLNDRSPRTFEQFYREETLSSVATAMANIVNVMNRLWQAPLVNNQALGECAQLNDTLFNEYRRLHDENKLSRMEKEFKEVEKIVDIEFDENGKLSFTISENKSIILYNPFVWIRKMFGNRRNYQERFEYLDDVNNRRNSIVHGDFHAGNILIEGQSEEPIIWLIDFPHSHIGPIVQDIARLEADIKFSLFPKELIKENLEAIIDFERLILGNGNRQSLILQNVRNLNVEGGNKNIAHQLEKAFRCLSILRHEDHLLNLPRNAVPYYLALLHATLPMLYYVDRSPWQKLYAFLSAALLCELLDTHTRN